MSLPLTTRFGADPLLDLEIANKRYVDNNSGSGNTFARVVKKLDEIVNNSSTLQNDDELLVALDANKLYGFLLTCIYTSAGIADFKWGWSVPAGVTMEWQVVSLVNSAALNQTQTKALNGLGVTIETMETFSGVIRVGATAGNVNLQWAQNTANASDTTMERGSFLVTWEETP